MVVLLEGSPMCTEELQSSVRVTIGFFVTSLTKALFHLRMMKATVFLGTFNATDTFLARFPRSVLRHNPVSIQFLRPHGLVFALTCTVNCGTLYRQFIDRWTPIKLQKHLKDDRWKHDAPELNLESHSKGSEYLAKEGISVFVFLKFLKTCFHFVIMWYCLWNDEAFFYPFKNKAVT